MTAVAPRRDLATPRPRNLDFLVLAAYAIGVAVIEMRHEPWRDEADCWLLARDAGFATFFHRMGLSGTPGLWHLILVPFARLGLPYATQAVLHVAIAMATAAIVLRRAPLPLVTRVLLVFSYFFAYEYAIVVRSYALSVLLLAAIAAMYERRFARPLLFGALVVLLANTNTHSLIVAATIGAAYLLEGRRAAIKGAVVMLAGGAAAALQLIPPADAITGGMIMRYTPNAFPSALAAAFFPTMIHPLTVAAGAVIVLAAIVAIRLDRGALLILLGTLAGLAYLFTYKWIGGLRHAGFVFLVVLFVLWIAKPSRERTIAAGLLTASLIASVISTATFWRLDYRAPFSGAKEMAAFINGAGLADLPIAAHSETTTSAVCPWLRHPLWYVGTGRLGTFNLWDKTFDRGLYMTYPEAEQGAREHFRGGRWLLLFNVEIPEPAAHGFKLLHATREPFAHRDEQFWLYEPSVDPARSAGSSERPR
jgi:hypothetical protein